jgi:menaquinone-specific isochorismate synthase
VLAGPGFGIAGVGSAMRLAVPGLEPAAAAVAEALARVEVEGPGGPVAVGALPFRPDRPGELEVPELALRSGADGAVLVATAPAERVPALLDRGLARLEALAADPQGQGGSFGPRPQSYRVEPVLPHSRWEALVSEAAAALRRGSLAKVVLAREVLVTADAPIAIGEVLRRLVETQRHATVFAVDGLVGASPELLVERRGEVVRSHPLAGTASGPDAERRLEAAKERAEHRLVVEAVAAALAPFCTHLSVPPAPAPFRAGDLVHLGTLVEGRLAPPARSALELVAALHPTPAVAGSPTEAALGFLAAAEALERGRYAGPVGFVDAAGDGRFVLAIRSAEIRGRRARLFAGAGVVEGSDPAAELEETRLKLEPVLRAIVRP